MVVTPRTVGFVLVMRASGTYLSHAVVRVSPNCVSKEGLSRMEIDQAVWPWHGQPNESAYKYAFGHLVENLPRRIAKDGQVHAETCLALAGVVAGFAAQRTLFHVLSATKDEATLAKIKKVVRDNGDTYIFGEPLNAMLYPVSTAEANTKLWSLLVGTAMSLGLAKAETPELRDLFENVSKQVGTETEGLTSVSAEHRPKATGLELLKAAWPVAHMCLTGRFAGSERAFGETDRLHWAALTSLAAATIMRKTNDFVPITTALTIVMESAIYGSKIDAQAVAGTAAKAA